MDSGSRRAHQAGAGGGTASGLPQTGDGDLAVQVPEGPDQLRSPQRPLGRASPGPAPWPRGDWSTPPQTPAPYLRGRGYLGPPHVARVPRRRLLGPRPRPRPRPFDLRSRAPRDVTAALIQRTLRPTRVSRQPARAGAGPASPAGAAACDPPAAGLCRSLRAARHVPPRREPPASARSSAALRPAIGPGMRTPPAPGGQVSRGRRARDGGAPGPPRSLGQGSGRSERGTSPARSPAPAPAPGGAALSALARREVGLPAARGSLGRGEKPLPAPRVQGGHDWPWGAEGGGRFCLRCSFRKLF